MLLTFFRKKTDEASKLSEVLAKLNENYDEHAISDERKEFLTEQMNKYGYLPYSQAKALDELTDAEVLFALKYKWQSQNVLNDNSFNFKALSPLKRKNINHSNWIKNNQHNIKLVNLASLGNGNENQKVKFFDWLRQLLILPVGNKNVMNTTIYLVPFHPREFGCAYLPASSEVSPYLYDEEIGQLLDMNKEEQVQLFIKLAQLAGHPVIYDVLPQTSRFSKMVLSNPYIARWVDVNILIKQIKDEIEKVKTDLFEQFGEEDVNSVVQIYKNILDGNTNEMSEHFQNIYNVLNEKMRDKKFEFTNKMSEQKEQAELQKRIREIIATSHGEKSFKFKKEEDITNQGESIQNLIKAGLWPMPGGAWCSCGVPIFDKMSDGASYPIFKHYNFKGEDVSHFANLDCQTPFYFVNFEQEEANFDVVRFFVANLMDLQEKYNFDGYRVDHIDHIVDEISQKDGLPISYRAPAAVLALLSENMKKKVPHFVMLAEYMLWDKFYKEYHQDMHFDLLWGNDIILQSTKTPMQIVEDNQELAKYNSSLSTQNQLSIIKTYNNQDGEFEAIDQYPGQLGEKGALFKWFKYKFLPGGELAQRPMMYIDGDESFTKTGVEKTIGSEISLTREKNNKFFVKFDAIRRFALNSEILNGGEAEILDTDDNGYVAWLVSKDPLKEHLLVVANYLSPTEKIKYDDENGNSAFYIKEGYDICDKKIEIPCDYKVVSEIKFSRSYELKEYPIKEDVSTLCFEKLTPSEFKIYKLVK